MTAAEDSAAQENRGLTRKIKLRVYQALNRPGLRYILALLAAIYASARVGKVCRVSYDGDWVQKFPSGTLVERRLTLLTYGQIEKLAHDLWMYHYLPAEGETVVDIGAGTGWETLVFSRRVGKCGRVISIEAHPRAFACLTKMRSENQLENTTLIQAAIIDCKREVLISDFNEYLGNRVVKVDSGIPVVGTTLDQIFQSLRLSQVDLLKMNIEGAEKQALEGMREMIRKTRHVCISCHDFAANEGWPDEMRTKADVIAFLEENDFAVFGRGSDPRPFVRDYVYGLNRKFLTDEKRCMFPRDASIVASVEQVVPSRPWLKRISLLKSQNH